MVQAHKDITHILNYAIHDDRVNYYIHIDVKVNLSELLRDVVIPKNVFFLNNRFDVKWAGFSQVRATIALFEEALSNKENDYFHLISGEDYILKDLKYIESTWINNEIYMECYKSKPHRYRLRFNAIHADSDFSRSFFGKVITKLYQLLDCLLPVSTDEFYYGSQWFSIRREDAIRIFDSISKYDVDKFKKKLCPDEHFFQYMIANLCMINKISKVGNKRFIKFDKDYNRGNNPIYLSDEQIEEAKEKDFWFARKYDFSKNN